MAAPILVKSYPGDRSSLFATRGTRGSHTGMTLPPISSYAFADILRRADSSDFQLAIDGIAEICAKNRMSLSDEYASHLPPLGEITAASSSTVRPQMLRPRMRRALTSVPEGSSGSSEGSQKSKKRMSGLFGFRKRQEQQLQPLREMRIGSMGRTIPVAGTTAMADKVDSPNDPDNTTLKAVGDGRPPKKFKRAGRRPSQAESSLQRLLTQRANSEAG